MTTTSDVEGPSRYLVSGVSRLPEKEKVAHGEKEEERRRETEGNDRERRERKRDEREGVEIFPRRETAGSSFADKSRDLFQGFRRKLIRRSGSSIPPLDSNLQQAFHGFHFSTYQPI